MLLNSEQLENQRLNIIDELRLWVAGFLMVDMQLISIDFLDVFEKVRQDVLSKIPEQVKDYNKKKQVHITNIKSTQANSKRRQIPITPYFDPRIKGIDPIERKVLLSLGQTFDMADNVPQDVVIRAVRSIRTTALLLLEGKDPARINGISQEQIDMEKGTRAIASYHNFLHKKRR